MAFICPNCARTALEIQLSLELPAGVTWDENTLQLAVCRKCGFPAAVLYQESRRGRLDDETWQHIGTIITQEEYRQFEIKLRSCPAPGNPGCRCAAHQNIDLNAIFQTGTPTFQMVRPSSV